ncbi:MAG: inverse autotransporter beta domain-containing protein [Rhodospirillales bacterium]|nr:inverse autotransporter beta domain-containing protein [Rhodospirillales bacterium]
MLNPLFMCTVLISLFSGLFAKTKKIFQNRARFHAALYCAIAVIFIVSAGFSAWANSEPFSNATSINQEEGFDDPNTRNVLRAFDIMQAVGEASNSGIGDEEALRQACAVFNESSGTALRTFMDTQVDKSSATSNFSNSKIGSVIVYQGESALASSLSSACAALTGQGNGEIASGFNTENLKDMAAGMAFEEGLGFIKSSGLPFTGNLEVSGNIFGDGGAGWEILTVQPLWHDAAKQNHIFTQLSWNRTNERKGYAEGDTINAGLAYRRLSDDRKILYGANVFFDHARQRNHNRMSIGADIQTSEIGVVANKYIPLSDWKSVDPYLEERSSNGFDLELQGRLPEYPAWQMNLKGYQWSSNEDMEQENTWGYNAGLQWNPVNSLVWEAGLRNEQDADPQFRTSLRWVYKFGEPLENMWKEPIKLASMEERVYDKVRRENAMRVEQRIKDSALVSVTESVGANTAITRDGTISLATGQELPLPFTVNVSAAGGSVVRLTFRNGGVLTIGAGSSVEVDINSITLISGVLQYVSGSTNVTINVPGGTVTLLGTDVDVSSDGTTSVLRVRDGQARLDGSASGTVTLNPGEAGDSINGVVAGGVLATNDPTFISHTDTVSESVDRAATSQTGDKITPYNFEDPRLTTTATLPSDPIVINLRFNTPVTVTGLPQLVLDINGNTRNAVYSGGTGTDDLAFTYTLQAGDAGATNVTVESLDLNGGTITANSKNAITTIADTVLNLGGSITDTTAPSGYAVAFTTDPVDVNNQSAAAFQITSAEVGTTYDYTISSTGGGTNVTGSGTITTATQNVTGIDVSSLGDGTLTLSLTLTDASTNTGAAATDTVVKDIITLALDFVNNAYELNGTSYGSFTAIPGASFSRASPATTYAEDGAGNLVAFAANQPRITDKGILIEGGRTNNLPFSNFQAGYVQQGATYTPNFAIAPDGTITAMRINTSPVVDPGGSAFTVRTYDAVNTTAGQVITTSVYVKPITTQSTYPVIPPDGASVQTRDLRLALSADQSGGVVFCNLDSQTVESESGGTTGHLDVLANGWMRCSITYTAVGNDVDDNQFIYLSNRTSNGNFDPYPDGNEEIYIWGHQSELGAFPSSYIPTNGAGVTRSEDDISLTTAGWYNNAAGTVVSNYEYLPVNPGYGFTYARNNSAIFRFFRSGFSAYQNQFSMGRYLAAGPGNPYRLTVSYRDANGTGSDITNISHLSTNLDGAGSFKSAARYGGSGVAITSDGIAPITNATVFNNFQFDTLRLDTAYDGSVGFKYLRTFDYYPSGKSNAELQNLTTP